MNSKKILRFLSTAAILAAWFFPIQPAGFASAGDGGAPRVIETNVFNWFSDRADAYPELENMSEHGLALDIDGEPHLAYGGDQLYYAHHELIGWLFEVADPTWGTGGGAAIALDSSNRPHISYVDKNKKYLKYATKPGASWILKTLDMSNSLDGFTCTSIALDSNGRAHIVYYDPWDYSLTYIYDTGSGYFSAPESFGAFGYPGPGKLSFTLVMDSTDKPHVSFYEVTGIMRGEMAYAVRDGSWTVDTMTDFSWVPNEECTGYYCIAGIVNSITLDASDHPHVAFFVGNEYDMIYYYHHTGSEWVDEPVTGVAGSPRALSLELYNGQPYLLLADNDGLEERHKTTGWQPAVLLEGGDTGWYASLKIDTSGRQRVSYFNKTLKQLRYTRYTGSAWQTPTTIATVGSDVGRFSSLGIDGTGRPHISYYDETTDKLLYRNFESGVWSGDTIDGSGTAAGLSSVALSGNTPTVVYQTKTGDLLYASHLYIAAHWVWFGSANPIDTGLSDLLSQRPSLAIDSTGKIKVAYIKGADLIYAYLDPASGWVKTTVDSGTNLTGVSLSLTGDDSPRIGYCKDGNLMYAYPFGHGSWMTEVAHAIGKNSFMVALDVRSGAVVMAFLDDPLGGMENLTVATRICLIGCSWITEDVPLNGELQFDLVVDEDGGVHLAYVVWEQSYCLNYAVKRYGQWDTLRFANFEPYDLTPSIGIGPDGRPAISHYHALNNDLIYTFMGDMEYLPVARKK